jgi:hypothetical protein
MALTDSIVVLVVSFLIGTLGIHVGARIVTGTNEFGYAAGTAFVGALVWSIVGFLFGGLPLVGPALVLLAYLWVIKRRYPGGWVTAAGIALTAWVAALTVLYVLATAGVTEFGAVGVPGV